MTVISKEKKTNVRKQAYWWVFLIRILFVFEFVCLFYFFILRGEGCGWIRGLCGNGLLLKDFISLTKSFL